MCERRYRQGTATEAAGRFPRRPASKVLAAHLASLAPAAAREKRNPENTLALAPAERGADRVIPPSPDRRTDARAPHTEVVGEAVRLRLLFVVGRPPFDLDDLRAALVPD